MILTIGHSTRTAAEFLALLRAHQIAGVADVRRVPRSRRHPHFSSDELSIFLRAHGIDYRHLAGLGGLRKPAPDSANIGWRHSAFRGYADYMHTSEFAEALAGLLEFAEGRPTAVMCAEAKWWQCHRQLIADALTARNIPVSHIMSPAAAPRHVLTPFARVEGTDVRYPGLV
jgi:uncharacterized protein (DUF488 family)